MLCEIKSGCDDLMFNLLLLLFYENMFADLVLLQVLMGEIADL